MIWYTRELLIFTFQHGGGFTNAIKGWSVWVGRRYSTLNIYKKRGLSLKYLRAGIRLQKGVNCPYLYAGYKLISLGMHAFISIFVYERINCFMLLWQHTLRRLQTCAPGSAYIFILTCVRIKKRGCAYIYVQVWGIYAHKHICIKVRVYSGLTNTRVRLEGVKSYKRFIIYRVLCLWANIKG